MFNWGILKHWHRERLEGQWMGERRERGGMINKWSLGIRRTVKRRISRRRRREEGGRKLYTCPMTKSYTRTLNKPTVYDSTFTLSFLSPCCPLSINSLLAIIYTSLKKKVDREGSGAGGRVAGEGRQGASCQVSALICNRSPYEACGGRCHDS